jgi:hypothetical protein
MQETKQSNSNVKLGAKHVILIATMNVKATSCSNMARVLGIHLSNIVTTMVRRCLTCDSGTHLWKLLVRKKKELILFYMLKEM